MQQVNCWGIETLKNGFKGQADDDVVDLSTADRFKEVLKENFGGVANVYNVGVGTAVDFVVTGPKVTPIHSAFSLAL